MHESKGVYRPARGLEELTAVRASRRRPARGPRGHASTSCSCARASARTSASSRPGGSRSSRSAVARACRGCPASAREIRDSAHALAMGKVVLSLLEPAAVARYVARGLTSFTPQTITSPDGARGRARARPPRRLRRRPRGVRRELLLHRGADLRRARPVRRRARAVDDATRVRRRARRLAATVVDVARERAPGAATERRHDAPADGRATPGVGPMNCKHDAENASFLSQTAEADLASNDEAASRHRPRAVTREPQRRSGG